ncbi:WD40/YVTN/BNR-like repeat-containing protein [Thermodesulfobacteriota bacterium]
MYRLQGKTSVILLVFLCCVCVAGCGKVKRKFKVPNIKMVTPEYILDAAEPEEGHIWIAGNYGVIFHSSDGGQTWEPQRSGVKTLLCDIEFSDRTTGWITGVSGVMLHTTDGGKNWLRQETGTQRHLLAGSFVEGRYGWAIGDFSTILHTSDGGATWASQRDEEDRIFSNVCFTDRENGWIVGERGTLLRTTDGGATWADVVPDFFKRETLEDEYDNPRPGLFGIYFSDKDHGWVCGVDSTIMHTSDGGTTWKVINTGQDILYNIQVRGSRGWAVGTQGTYLLSRDGGMTWEKQEETIKSKLSFSNLHFSSPDRGWITGAGGTLVRTTDGGETWSFYSGLSYEFEGIRMPEALEKRIIE